MIFLLLLSSCSAPATLPPADAAPATLPPADAAPATLPPADAEEFDYRLLRQEPAPSPTPRHPKRADRAVDPSRIWFALSRCENDKSDDSASGKFHGWFQFTTGSWRSVGGKGDPHKASWTEQLKRAKLLQARDGWGAWPECSKKLGLYRG